MAAAWWLAAHRWCRHGAGTRAIAEQQRRRGGVARGRLRSGELRARRRLGVVSRRRVSGDGGAANGRVCGRRFREKEEKQ